MSGTIDKRVDLEGGLAVFTVRGMVSAEMYAQTIQDFYDQGPVTKNVLWDLTESTLDHLRTEDVKQIGRVPRKFVAERAGGKTAIVAPTDLAFGLARMYEFSAEPAEVPFAVKVYRSMEEAVTWLSSGE